MTKIIEDYTLIDNHTIFYKYLIIDPLRPTVIFLHDSLGCVELWRDFPEKIALETNYNILIYDREGHGKSSDFLITERSKNYLSLGADILYKIIKKLNINKHFLFGHSDGASIALLYAAKYTNNLLGSIVEGVHVFVENETITGINNAKIALQTTNLKERVNKYHGNKTNILFKLWMDTWLSDGYRDWNIEKNIKTIKCPLLIFQGENDEFGTIEQVNRIKKNVNTTVYYYLIENCGHNPHKEQTEFTLWKTVEFLNKYNYDEII